MTYSFFKWFFDIIFGGFLLFGAKLIFSTFSNESQPGQACSARPHVNKNKKKVRKRVDTRAKPLLTNRKALS